MLEDWTADVVGRMHKAQINGYQLAARVGISATHLSLVLNGHKGNNGSKARIISALESLEQEIMGAEAESETSNGSD